MGGYFYTWKVYIALPSFNNANSTVLHCVATNKTDMHTDPNILPTQVPTYMQAIVTGMLPGHMCVRTPVTPYLEL
jgi:hypothetical protein